jgi:hypothetical protein
MSFERSVIIPHKLYKKCKLPSTDKEAIDILTDNTLPSDEKLKLYDHEVIKKSSSSKSTIPTTPTVVVPRWSHILHNIPDKDKPVVKSLLDIVEANPSVLDYTPNLELIIDGRPLAGSNIVNILLYLTRNVPVTSSTDIPIGSAEFYDRLIQLGMPSVWVKQRPSKRPRASTRLTGKRKKIKLLGDWESY